MPYLTELLLLLQLI